MKKYLIALAALLALPVAALAVNITVPSAPGAGYVLVSTSTGAYNYAATSSLGISGGGLTRTNVSTVNTINNQPFLSNWLNFTGSGATIVITGVASQPDGTRLVITNDAATYILVPPQNASSLAANRFIGITSASPGIKIYPGQSAEFAYDGNASRWRYVSSIATSLGSSGQIDFSDGNGNWDQDGGNFTYAKSFNRLQVTNEYTTSEQDIGGALRLLFANLGDGGLLYTKTISGVAGFIGQSDPSSLFFDSSSGRTGLGTSTPPFRLSDIAQITTVNAPASFSAFLAGESLISPPSDSLSLVYGPLAPSSAGSANENAPSGSVYVCNGQNWDYFVYSYRTINGVEYTNTDAPLDVNFQETVNDGSTNFTVSMNWPSAVNGDGSAVDGYIVYSPGTGNYTDVGNTTSWFDDGTSPGGASPNTFSGFTASFQSVSYDLNAKGISPSGGTYFNDNSGSNVFNITDSYGNGSMFWISHNISGSGGNNWRETDASGGFDGTGDQQFYQTNNYFGSSGNFPQHYGIQSNGSALNIDLDLYSYNGSIYSSTFLTASVTDPSDGNYYYVGTSYGVPSTFGKMIEQVNGGGFNVGQLVSGSSQSIDALGPAFTDGVAVVPNSAPNTSAYFENSSKSKTVPIAIFNANDPSGVPAISFQKAGSTFAQLYSNGVNSLVTDANFTANFFIGNGSALTNLNASNISSGVLPVSFGGTGDTTISNGQILFGNTTSNILTSGNLFWDNISKRLGIGTTSPSAELTVQGISGTTTPLVLIASSSSAISPYFQINSNGFIGIGTSTPSQPLTVAGNEFLKGALFDSTNASGTTAQILESVGNGVKWISQSALNILGLVTSYNGETTAGNGLMAIIANNDLTGQSGAVTVTTATSTNDGVPHTYRIGGYANVTAVTLDVIQYQATYTDENNSAATVTFFPQGLTSANIASTGNFPFPTMDVRVKANTLMTVKTILTTGTGSITYDVGGNIEKIK